MKNKVILFAVVVVCFFGFISEGFSQDVNTLQADQLKKLESISAKDNVSNPDPAAVTETVKAFKEKSEGRNARTARTFYCGANDFKAVAGTTWEFTYNMTSATFTDTIVIESSVKTDDDGDCYLSCYDADDSGSLGRVYYTDRNEIGLGFWAYVLNSDGDFMQNYEFSVSGNTASGLYYFYLPNDESYSDSYSLTGNKVNGGNGSYVSSLLIADFGYYGLYKYDGSYWTGILAESAESMTAWEGKVAVDLGSQGLFLYDGSSFSGIASWNAENVIVWNDNLIADFGGYGIYLYNGYSWAGLSTWNPDSIVAWGDKLAADFGSDGISFYNGRSWTSIVSGWNAESMTAWGDYLAVDFGANGLWLYDGSSWSGLTAWNAEGMSVWLNRLVIDFGTKGLYMYVQNMYGDSSWTGLATWNAENIAVLPSSFGDNLIVDFGNYGMWMYDGFSWTGITGWNPESMTIWENNLVTDFGSNGLWLYEGSSWTGLAGWNCDDMEVLSY